MPLPSVAEVFELNPTDVAPPGSRVVLAVDWLGSVPDEAKKAIARIEEAGYQAIVHPTTSHMLDEAQMLELVPGVAAIIAGAHRFSRNVLERADELRVISRHGAGFETIDVDACTSQGVVVTNAGWGTNSAAVAEFTLALILAVGRRLGYSERRLRAGDWNFRSLVEGDSPIGRTLGLVGLGYIGKAVVPMAKAFRMDVIYYDVRRDEAFEDAHGVRFVDFDDLLREADFVSLHVALNEATHHMIGDRELKLMKPGAYIVNTSRGGIIDEVALHRALIEREIAGAALDTFESEPTTADNPLFALDEQVVVTPHIAGVSRDAKKAMLEVSCTNLLAVLAGRRPKIVTNPEVYDGAPA